jgi:hypothetical protein
VKLQRCVIADGGPPFKGAPPSRFVLRSNNTTIAVIVPDADWPGMWHVSAGGQFSDMVNLTRAKDAAESAAEREGYDPRLLRWMPMTATAGLARCGKSATSPSLRSISTEGGVHA